LGTASSPAPMWIRTTPGSRSERGLSSGSTPTRIWHPRPVIGMRASFIAPRWGKTPLAKVTHAELQRWVSSIDGAPATVRKVHRVMSQLLAWAVADDRLAKNPAEKISLPRVRQAERRFLDHE
jgi:hypothetical protein